MKKIEIQAQFTAGYAGKQLARGEYRVEVEPSQIQAIVTDGLTLGQIVAAAIGSADKFFTKAGNTDSSEDLAPASAPMASIFTTPVVEKTKA